MQAKVSVFVICVEVITFLLLYNLHDYTFKHLGKLTPYFWNIYTLWEGICSRNNLWGQKIANDNCLVSKSFGIYLSELANALISFGNFFY